MQYPVRLVAQKDAGNVAVYFPDIPEALTLGSTTEEALCHAVDAFETAMDFYFDQRRPVPLPSPPKRGQRLVTIPITLSAKILLYNEVLHQKIRPATLAMRMNVRPQEVTRLLNLRHSTKIERLAAALSVMGKRLDVSVHEGAHKG